ncbi:MAG: DUF2974 domain-containing protein [Treponema sp.]|nr:DUF2974 domain-containing protein [Treponema sp.]
MSNLFDYIEWRGDIPFEQVPLNQIDALMFAHITYSLFDGLVPESFSESITFEQLAKNFKAAPDFEKRTNVGFLINKQTTELLFRCAESERYKKVKLCGMKVVFDEKKREQFAAILYSFGDVKILAFRGTDDTLMGWEEDFNLAYLDEIPAQVDALAYFKEAAAALKGNFVIVGHSKGGNLAVNTAVRCGEELQKRIDLVYNFDGPGFSKEFFASAEYKAMEKKISSVYPEFSVVGMLFNHPKKYQIVESSENAVMQHDAMSWQILGSAFVQKKRFNSGSIFFAKGFNKWVDGLSKEDRKTFVNALFNVINASGAKTIDEMQNNVLPCSAKMLAAYASLDRPTKKEVRHILGLFKESMESALPVIKLISR